MELKTVTMEIPDEANIIIGQSHFIKTVEDLYEIMVTSLPQAQFGIAFCEASGPCLVRAEGNDEALKETAMRNAHALAAGHCFGNQTVP
jgi:adenosine/AMP kinase